MKADEAEQKPGVRTADKELVAMTAISRALAGLSEAERGRVLGWVVAKYVPAAGS